ncbi:hypothetical protein Hdeb2414_s0004g00139881 [Helianthus debilis subsp. tardiflorus]
MPLVNWLRYNLVIQFIRQLRSIKRRRYETQEEKNLIQFIIYVRCFCLSTAITITTNQGHPILFNYYNLVLLLI